MPCFLPSIYHPVLLSELLLLSVLSAVLLLQMVSQQREPSSPPSPGNSRFSAESGLVCSLTHELICQLTLDHTNTMLLSIFAPAWAPMLRRLTACNSMVLLKNILILLKDYTSKLCIGKLLTYAAKLITRRTKIFLKMS